MTARQDLDAAGSLVERYYDDLAPYYSLIYEDWPAAVIRQAGWLDGLIKERCVDAARVLDVACGIGTQAIGLAGLGYALTANDISVAAVEEAKRCAQSAGASISLGVADMRIAVDGQDQAFDVAIACDNSIAHLLTDDDLLAALRRMFDALRPGGCCLISVRDYDIEEKSGMPFKPYGVRIVDGVRHILWQVWEYDPGSIIYTTTFYVVVDDASSCRTMATRSRCRAMGTEVVVDLMRRAGFESVDRFDGRFFQPIIVGVKS